MIFICLSVKEAVLAPPLKKMSAKDVVENNYNQQNLLEKFKCVGDWKVDKKNDRFVLIGESRNSSIYIKSNDKITRGPKEFIFDFSVEDPQKIYGIIYGHSGIIIENGQIYKVFFNETYSSYNKLAKSRFEVKYLPKFLDNTVEIATGYEPLGETGIQCVIYINGIGSTIACPDGDVSFGVYLAAENKISISGFRWQIGSH
jgi:hypothetical protein